MNREFVLDRRGVIVAERILTPEGEPGLRRINRADRRADGWRNPRMSAAAIAGRFARRRIHREAAQ